jgi:riboflavin synthase
VFTGIVREVGRVEAVEERGESVRLVVRAPETAAAAAVGDSVSLAGVCRRRFAARRSAAWRPAAGST